MRTFLAFGLCSFLALALFGCSDVPPYWAKLGIPTKGGQTRKDMASDTFLVVFYERDASALGSTCKEAYAPIVAQGWTPVVADPGDGPGNIEQVLTSGTDKISITCMPLADIKNISVTFRHR